MARAKSQSQTYFVQSEHDYTETNTVGLDNVLSEHFANISVNSEITVSRLEARYIKKEVMEELEI